MAELVKIDSAMVKTFEIDLVKVQEMVKKYQELKLIPKDTESYKVCRAALTHCISNRTSIDKRRLELNSEDQAKIKKRNDVAKQLTELIAPAEDYLSVLVKGEDNRKTEIKAEKERKELERIEGIRGKIADINSFGSGLTFDLTLAQLNDILYAIEAIEITPDEYMELTAEANLVKHDVHIAIQKAIEAREKFEAEEAARVAEKARLAKEKARLDKIKEEQETAQKAIDDANAEIETKRKGIAEEVLERKRNARIAALNNIGLQFDGEQFCYHDFNVHHTELVTLSDDEFTAIIKDLGAKVKDRKANDEKAVKIQAEKDAQEKVEREAKEKEEQERTEAEERARQEALKPDKEKLLDWLKRLTLQSAAPFVEDQKLLDLSQEVNIEFMTIINKAMRQIEEL